MKDFTKLAVERQLSVMNCTSYEVGILHKDPEGIVKNDVMVNRIWSKTEILNSLGWLKRQNVDGAHIYIRPQGSIGLIFFDDFNRKKLADLEAFGLKPAICLQSSPDNFQGWIRISANVIEPAMATAIAQVIAKKFGGDFNNADWRHYGRMAGFTNRKPMYVDEVGRYPFVKLDEANYGVAPGAQAIIDEAIEYKKEKEAEMEAKRIELRARLSQGKTTYEAPDEFYKRELGVIVERFSEGKYDERSTKTGGVDRTRADWMIGMSMLKSGYAIEDIEYAYRTVSPKCQELGLAMERYINTTLTNLTTYL